jgi:hypothetical protein
MNMAGDLYCTCDVGFAADCPVCRHIKYDTRTDEQKRAEEIKAQRLAGTREREARYKSLFSPLSIAGQIQDWKK